MCNPCFLYWIHPASLTGCMMEKLRELLLVTDFIDTFLLWEVRTALFVLNFFVSSASTRFLKIWIIKDEGVVKGLFSMKFLKTKVTLNKQWGKTLNNNSEVKTLPYLKTFSAHTGVSVNTHAYVLRLEPLKLHSSKRLQAQSLWLMLFLT